MFSGQKCVQIAVISVAIMLVGSVAWAMSPDTADHTGSSNQPIKEEVKLLEKLNLEFSALVEVEAAYVDDSSDPGESSDFTLATVEIGVDAAPVKHVSAHVLFLFEEGDTDPIEVDEAIIQLDGEDKMPFFISAGRQYLPFGGFESHFISDPLTLELGETSESSIIVGYDNDMLGIALGIFNGDVEETGEIDNHIDGYAAGVVFTPKGSERFGLKTGFSYISNIGESDALQGEDGIDVDAGNTITSYVPGLAAFVSINVFEKLFFEAEVVAALDDFLSGELAFDNGEALKPVAYNTELIYQLNDQMAAGLRLAGTQDGGSFLPETQYGVVVTYTFFEGVALGLEYQYGEFDTLDNRDVTTVTAQLGFEL